MRIISASRRTDIPAFYSKWFMNRIREGFCHWINPFNTKQILRVSLTADDCLAIVFWTRNPKPLLGHLNFLRDKGYHFYFHFTINGYPKEIESHIPPVSEAIAVFRQLAEMIGPELVQWRYDPILLSGITPESYHLEQFEFISRELEGYTRRCYFSFMDLCGAAERGLRRIEQEYEIAMQQPLLEDQLGLIHKLQDMAASRGIAFFSCCGTWLVGRGIRTGQCIGADLLQMAGSGIDKGLRRFPSRKQCNCAEAIDIGAYDTCIYGCAYCYATGSFEASHSRFRDHDPEDTALCRPPTLLGLELESVERVFGVRPPSRQHPKSASIREAQSEPSDKLDLQENAKENLPIHLIERDANIGMNRDLILSDQLGHLQPNVEDTVEMEYISKNAINYLYHMTAIDNLPNVLAYGLLSHNEARTKRVLEKDISDPEVQDLRSRRIIYDIPLHDYVCLYFYPRNPMLYVYKRKQEAIVFLGIDPSLLLDPHTVFTDGNAASRWTRFCSQKNQLDHLPWDIIRSHHWSQLAKDDKEWKRVRCAEVLVYPRISVTRIQKIFCCSEKQRRSVCEMIPKGATIPVEVKRKLYAEEFLPKP
ncbi:MAG: DarT ssDNA thymidine ADP-ribosyltransferase family protein [Chloroflexi bacterium]|nr:DarT ssDNA thymidine ADP-ribosyltransferase family protein [Chloroflexota bacterium]